MPIQVIIVLFVAVVVGGAIIVFAQRTIPNPGELTNRISEIRTSDQLVIVSLSSASADDIKALASTCAQQKTITAKDCFVVKGAFNVASVTALNGQLAGSTPIKTTVSGTPNAIFISYDPMGFVTVSS